MEILFIQNQELLILTLGAVAGAIVALSNLGKVLKEIVFILSPIILNQPTKKKLLRML
jgi:hypothetical protein